MSQPQTRKATWRWSAREQILANRLAVIAIILLLAFALRPVLLGLIQRRDFVTCQTNVQRIARGLGMYANDYDNTLPIASSWMDAASGNMAAASGTGFRVEDLFHCPRDKSGSPSSYAYNDLVNGLPLEAGTRGQNLTVRLREIGHLDRAPLVIEKYGSPRNAHVILRNWNDVIANMTTPHDLSSPTGTLITGRLQPGQRTKDELEELRDKRF